jgi:hypothetical protein
MKHVARFFCVIKPSIWNVYLYWYDLVSPIYLTFDTYGKKNWNVYLYWYDLVSPIYLTFDTYGKKNI